MGESDASDVRRIWDAALDALIDTTGCSQYVWFCHCQICGTEFWFEAIAGRPVCPYCPSRPSS